MLVWGLDAMAVTFVAPHSLHARPLVVPRGLDLLVWNVTAGAPMTVIADGHRVGELPPGEARPCALGDRARCCAATPR